MANTVYGNIVDTGTTGNVLTSNGAGVAPSFQSLTLSAPSTYFYPGLQIQGFNASVSGAVILSTTPGQPYFSAYKACTCYEIYISAFTTNATATTLTFQPYGAPSGGNGNYAGTTKNLSVPSTGAIAQGSQTFSISLTTSGYLGVAVQASPASNLTINATLWFSQTAI